MNSRIGLDGLGRFGWGCRGGRSRGRRFRFRFRIAIVIVMEGDILIRVYVHQEMGLARSRSCVGCETYVGASFEEINSTSSGGSSRSLKPCWRLVCVKRMLRAA